MLSRAHISSTIFSISPAAARPRRTACLGRGADDGPAANGSLSDEVDEGLGSGASAGDEDDWNAAALLVMGLSKRARVA